MRFLVSAIVLSAVAAPALGAPRGISPILEELQKESASDSADIPSAQGVPVAGPDGAAGSRALDGGGEYKPALGARERAESPSEVGIVDSDNEFSGELGGRFKARIEDVAQKVQLDPGLLAASVLAEIDGKAGKKIFTEEGTYDQLTYDVGADDYMDKSTQDIIRRYRDSIPGFREAHVTGSGEATNRNEQGRNTTMGHFPVRESTLIVGIYLKTFELRAREDFANLGKKFDEQPVEVRFTLTRYGMNAGAGRLKQEVKRIAEGGDIPRTGSTHRNFHHPLRTAVLHAARAIHLSQKIFGRKLSK